jgi:hypothetical protein
MHSALHDPSILFGGLVPHFDCAALRRAWLRIDEPIKIIERCMPVRAQLSARWSPAWPAQWRSASGSGQQWKPSALKRDAAAEICHILEKMAKSMPLDDRPEAGVVEGLEFHCGGGGLPTILIQNAAWGDEECCSIAVVDATGADGEWPHLMGRCEGRVRAAQLGMVPTDSWSAALLRRVTRPYGGTGSCCLIEPGMVRLVELIELAGGETLYSCEGHPGGAYVAFRKKIDSIAIDALKDIGFSLKNRRTADGSVSVVHAPPIADFDARDKLLRAACSRIEDAIGASRPRFASCPMIRTAPAARLISALSLVLRRPCWR